MKDLKLKNLALVVSFLFLVIVAASFYWLWQDSQPNTDSAIIDEKYQTVDITSEKKKAENLVQGKENFTNMPIQAPTTSGRVDPFAGL
jgi:hypothetical protein